MLSTIPTTGVRLAPGSNPRPAFRPGRPTLSDRLRRALRRARPLAVVHGEKLAPVVSEASKVDAALLTRSFERAVDWLAANPRVPIQRLYDLAAALVTHVRVVRGIPVPSLRVAMRHEEAANAALNIAQWADEGPLTLGRLYTLRDAASVQWLATVQLVQAVDAEIQRLEAA